MKNAIERIKDFIIEDKLLSISILNYIILMIALSFWNQLLLMTFSSLILMIVSLISIIESDIKWKVIGFSDILVVFIAIITLILNNIWVNFVIAIIFVLSILNFVWYYYISSKEDKWFIDFSKFIAILLYWFLALHLIKDNWSSFSMNSVEITSIWAMMQAIIWWLMFFWLFWIQNSLSKWKALWEWDVLLSIPLWLLLWFLWWIAWVFEAFLFSYISATVFYVWRLFLKRILLWQWDKDWTEVPFWQFIILWFFVEVLVLLFNWSPILLNY